jgi:hypothetical protein
VQGREGTTRRTLMCDDDDGLGRMLKGMDNRVEARDNVEVRLAAWVPVRQLVHLPRRKLFRRCFLNLFITEGGGGGGGGEKGWWGGGREPARIFFNC